MTKFLERTKILIKYNCSSAVPISHRQ